MSTILTTSRSFGSGQRDLVAELETAGHHVLFGDPRHDLESMRSQLASADAWIAGSSPVTSAHLAHAPSLRVVARYGIGVDAVDLDAAARRRITVTNTPGANSDAVADLTVALMLAALRSIVLGDRRARSGDWRTVRGRQLGDLRVGIVGFGRIGRGVAYRLSGFGSTILAADPVLSDHQVRDAGAVPSSVEDLASSCDLVTLHAPGGQTIIDRAWLDRIRSPLTLVNCARADLIAEQSLADALRDGRVQHFAADTVAGDVTSTGHSPLLADDLADKVTITPHLGAQTVEAVDAMGTIAVQNVLAVLDGRTPPHPVAPPA